jgi:rRNA processing protein Krr1/Pno1
LSLVFTLEPPAQKKTKVDDAEADAEAEGTSGKDKNEAQGSNASGEPAAASDEPAAAASASEATKLEEKTTVSEQAKPEAATKEADSNGAAAKALEEPEPSPAPAAVEPAKAPAPAASVPNGLPPGLTLPAGLPTTAALAAPVNPNTAATLTNPTSIIEERGEVSALYVGRVIGKGGEMIRDLQARSSCRIDVDQNVPPGQPRVITYRGTRKTVDFAKHLVAMLCSENATEADLPLGEAKREFLVVPAQSVGKIIGRGGEMIRELQSRSQGKIQVDHSGAISGLDASEKQVTITGTEQSVAKAKEMVLFLVNNPMMDAMQALTMLVEDKLHHGGVWGSGPPYANFPSQGYNMQPTTGGGGGGGPGYDPQQTQHYGGGGGGPPAGATSQAPTYAGATPTQHAVYGSPHPGGYGAAPAYQQHQQQQSAAPAYNQYAGASVGVEMEVFYCARNFMGRIIGQKGVTINDLQRRSTCDIQINQDVQPGQDCEISIRGSRQAIETAKQMLRDIIEIGPNHPYAGGNREYDYMFEETCVVQSRSDCKIDFCLLRASTENGGGDGGGYQQPQQQQQGYGHAPQAQGYHQQQQAAAAYGHQHQGYNQQYQAASYGRPTGGHQNPHSAPYAQQPTYQGHQASQAYGQPPAAPPAATVWKSATSPDGQIYYYNERTGETQWEKPRGVP